MRKLLVAVTAVCVVLAAPAVARAQDVLPLDGETFAGSEIPPVGESSFTSHCDPTGESTVTYTTSGPAIGPYAGTYYETGTFTLGPVEPNPLSPSGSSFTLLDFRATFTIDSPTGTVTGTKTLDTSFPFPENFASCGTELVSGPQPYDTATLRAHATYSATIESPLGRATDSGVSYVDWGDVAVRDIPNFQGFRFTETFVSTSFLLASTPGKATGGGEIDPATTFGFVAMRDADSTAKGQCEVVDHLTGTDLRCLDVTGYFQIGNEAFFSGHAEVDGTPTNYRADVVDGGEPGVGGDTFSIETDSGFAEAGPVTAGDIQVHGSG